MDRGRYYGAPALFRGVGRVLKTALREQEELNDAGVMIRSMVLRSELMPDEALQGVKFPKKEDLYLSGRGKPPYMAIRLTVEAVPKEQ